MKRDFTIAQTKVFETALLKLKKESWFRGVCTDNFPTDTECVYNFKGAVNSVIMETEMWDNHSIFG